MGSAETSITDNKNNLIAGIGLALLATFLWSGNFIAARALNHSLPPIALSFFRWSIATLFLLPFAYKSVLKEWSWIRPHFFYLSGTALTGVTLFNTFVYIAGKFSSATNMALIGTTAAPVFVLLISRIYLKQKVSGHQVTGAVFCIAGILLLLSKGRFSNLSHFRLSAGDIWIIAAALSFAVYTLLVKSKPVSISPVPFLFSIFCLGTIYLLPAFLIERMYAPPFTVIPSVIAVLFYLGIGASVIAFLSWNICIQKIGAPRTALFGNLIPIFSTIEAGILLHEPFNRIVLLSLLVILTGLTIANFYILKSAP